MIRLPAWNLMDFSSGRYTPQVIGYAQTPPNSVKDSLNVNFDEIVGQAKVRPGTTVLGTGPGLNGFLPQGIAQFVPGSGATLGSELVTNGTFTGNANGWTLGDGWTYNTNNVIWTAIGLELITNGTFTGSATGWTLGSGSPTGGWAYSSNSVSAAYTFNNGNLSQTLGTALVSGKTYFYSVDVSNINLPPGTGGVSISFSGQGLPFDTIDGNGTFTGSITIGPFAGGTNFFLSSGHSNGGSVGVTIDNVSVKLINQGALAQDIGALSNYTYEVSVTAGGTTGYVTVALGTNSFNVAAGSTVTQQLTATTSLLSITATSDFNGTVDTISAKQVLNKYLLVVYNGVAQAALYFWDGVQWNTSNYITGNDIPNRFTTLGGKEFVTNASTGMFSSPDASTWSTGPTNDCIDAANATPSLIFRYKQRLLAAGDPTYPDRVFFSSVIDPTSSPFITWNTDPTTGDWIDVNPDDGGNITGFSENSTFCLVFKDTGMYRLDTVNKTVDPDNIFDVGATAQEAIVLCMGVTYYFSGNGIYRTNGGYPEQISRAGVQDIIDALAPSSWEKVAAGSDGLNVYFSLGSVIVNRNKTNQRTINNCVLKFSPRDQSWSVHRYLNYFNGFDQYTDVNGPLMRGASDAGTVQTINLGQTDAGAGAINYFCETQDLSFGNRAHGKGIADKMVIFTDEGGASQLACRIDGGDLKPIKVQLANRVSMATDLNIQANFLNFYWFGSSTGNPPILEGYQIEDIDDLGMQSTIGTSGAPPRPPLT